MSKEVSAAIRKTRDRNDDQNQIVLALFDPNENNPVSTSFWNPHIHDFLLTVRV